MVTLKALEQPDGDGMTNRFSFPQLNPRIQADSKVRLDHFGLLAMDHRRHSSDDIRLDIG